MFQTCFICKSFSYSEAKIIKINSLTNIFPQILKFGNETETIGNTFFITWIKLMMEALWYSRVFILHGCQPENIVTHDSMFLMK